MICGSWGESWHHRSFRSSRSLKPVEYLDSRVCYAVSGPSETWASKYCEVIVASGIEGPCRSLGVSAAPARPLEESSAVASSLNLKWNGSITKKDPLVDMNIDLF